LLPGIPVVPLLEWMTDVARVIGSIFCLVTLPVAVQPTDDIMLLSGGNSRKTTYTTTNRIDD